MWDFIKAEFIINSSRETYLRFCFGPRNTQSLRANFQLKVFQSIIAWIWEKIFMWRQVSWRLVKRHIFCSTQSQGTGRQECLDFSGPPTEVVKYLALWPNFPTCTDSKIVLQYPFHIPLKWFCPLPFRFMPSCYFSNNFPYFPSSSSKH